MEKREIDQMNKIYKFIFESGSEGRTLTELSRKFRNVNRDQMSDAIARMTDEEKVREASINTKGRPIVRVVAIGGEPEEIQTICAGRGMTESRREKMIRQHLLERLSERVEEKSRTNYCPICGTDISGRRHRATTYTAAVAMKSSRGLRFSIDVWRVCESCAIKIMTGEHRDLIVSGSIGAAVIRNMEAAEANRG